MLLSNERKEKLRQFAENLGLKFNNLELLDMALCHPSYAYDNGVSRLNSYERLEFLGDAVLKLAVSDLLYNSYENKNEGELTIQRATAVSDKTIAEFALKINLENLILTGKCEKDAGNKKESILACAFEALLGAIYLEGKENGFNIAKDFLINNFKEEFLNISYQNPKAKLQELTQEINHDRPNYVLLKENGPAHKKVFTVGVYYRNEFIDSAEALTKKDAEMLCAEKAYIKIKEKYKKEN